jgi:hypothetical protein
MRPRYFPPATPTERLSIMKWLIARLAEPSTWAGLGAIAGSIIPAAQNHNWLAVAGVVAGAVATVTKG